MNDSASFLRFFGLTEEPFSKEIADRDLWLPPSKQLLVDELCEALHQHEQVLLVGEPGAGKTCVLRAAAPCLPQAGFRLTYCHNATLGRRDFYRQLCPALGLTPAATAAAVFYAVTTHVETLGRERIHPVFLLDEAHLLHQDMLDHLHILLNYEWDSRALLSLVLVGLPELEDRLGLRKNRSLYSRIHRRLVDRTDSRSTTRPSTSARGCAAPAAIASSSPPTRSPRCTRRPARACASIDRLATAALREAARRKLKLVEREVLAHVLDLDAKEAA